MAGATYVEMSTGAPTVAVELPEAMARKRVGCPGGPATVRAYQLFGGIQAQGWEDLDPSAVIRVIELLSGMGEGAGGRAGHSPPG